MKPKSFPSGRVLTALCAAFAVQNIEETLFMPGWLADHLSWVPSVTTSDYALATGLLTVGLIGLCLWGHRATAKTPTVRLVLALCAGALLANAGVHVVMSLATQSLMPGVVSGLLLQGPAALLTLVRLGLGARQIGPVTAAGLVLNLPLAAAMLLLAKLVQGGN